MPVYEVGGKARLIQPPGRGGSKVTVMSKDTGA